MFGYLKPDKSELKGKYTDEYRHEYCTLCHGLKENFGLLSTVLLNDECTFLYVFLSSLYPITELKPESFRCPMNPIRKHTVSINKDALMYASFVNYHLALLKVYDGCVDSHWLKRGIYKITLLFMFRNRKYKRLYSSFENMAHTTDTLCKKLYCLEAANFQDFDFCANIMGDVLYEIMDCYLGLHPIENQKLILEFSKHLGMWIYLIDAFDDFESDNKSGSFNPLNSFADDFDHKEAEEGCLRTGEIMLGMMTDNLTQFLQGIYFHRHNELIENIVRYGTRHAVRKIKYRRNKKKDERTCNR